MTEKHLESVASALDPKRPIARGHCPFCSGSYSAGTAPALPGHGAPPGRLLHTLPPCERFIRLNALAFLRAVRHELEARVRGHRR
jgi:hypothetical protein